MAAPPGPLPLLRCRARDVLPTTDVAEPGAGQPDSYCCRFCPRPGSRHVLASADEDGMIKLWDTRLEAQQRVILTEPAHTNAIYELDWSRDGRHLLSAAGDRAVKLWDVDRLMMPLAEFRRHARTVKTATFLPEDPCIFASGDRDGVIKVWDMRVTRQISHEIRPKGPDIGRPSTPGKGYTPDTITCLLFRDDRYLLSAVSGNSAVSVWDLRKLYSSHRQPPPAHTLGAASPCHGVVSMSADRHRDQLYVSRINGGIQRYSMANWTEDYAGTFSGHRCGTFYVRCAVSPDGTRLASGSSGGSGGPDLGAFLWSTAVAGPPAARLPGHREEVTCVAWSADSNTLATVSDDLHLRLWRTDPGPGDPSDDPSTLLMERPERPAGCGEALSPLPLHTFRRETGTQWRPGRARAPPPPPPPPPVANQRPRRAARAASAGSSAFLAGWLRSGGRAAGDVASRTSPRKRRDGGGEERESAERQPPPLTLSPSKMCFAPGSPTRSGQVTPVQSPVKRHAISLSPSKAGAVVAGAITPTGVCSERLGATHIPEERGTATPSKSPGRRRLAQSPSHPSCSTGRSPRRQLLNGDHGPTPTRTSPRKSAASPHTPAGPSLPHSPHTPGRTSPRKTPAKALFPGATCQTPEALRLRPAELYRSPTANLPNFVVDGRSPHRPVSTRPRRQPRADWLTRLSQRKRAQASPAAAPPAAKRGRRSTGPRRKTPG